MGLWMEQIQAALPPPPNNERPGHISSAFHRLTVVTEFGCSALCSHTHTRGEKTKLNLLTNVKQINIYRYVNDIY